LLNSTPRQIYLQRLLGFSTPHYMHLPIAVNEAGEKLSKQTLAAPADISQPATTLLRILDFLQQQPPAQLADSDVKTVLAWAVENWNVMKLRGVRTLPASRL
jgi:glutamyl-Q tRNA(Asp) synthetase